MRPHQLADMQQLAVGIDDLTATLGTGAGRTALGEQLQAGGIVEIVQARDLGPELAPEGVEIVGDRLAAGGRTRGDHGQLR